MPSPIKQFTINSLRRQTWKCLGTFRGKDSATVVLGGVMLPESSNICGLLNVRADD